MQSILKSNEVRSAILSFGKTLELIIKKRHLTLFTYPRKNYNQSHVMEDIDRLLLIANEIEEQSKAASFS